MKDYYAAYIIDPLGNNVEVVYFGWILLRLKMALQWALPAFTAASLTAIFAFVIKK